MRIPRMRFLPARVGRRIPAAVVITLPLIFVVPGAVAEEPPVFAISNARIVAVAGPPIEKGTVVLRNGIIEAVGASVTVPGDARIIDGTGLTVYPGLIDSLSDIGLEDQRQQASPVSPAPGAPGTPPPSGTAQQTAPSPDERQGLTPYRQAAEMLSVASPKIEEARNAGITTALVAPRGRLFPGQSSLVNLSGGEPGRMIVRTPVAFHIALAGARGPGSGFPGSLMGAFAFVKQALLDARQYAEAWNAYNANPGVVRPDFSRALESLQPLIDRRLRAVIAADDPVEIRRVLDLAEEYKLDLILAGAADAAKMAPVLSEKKVPVLLNVKFPEKERDADPEARAELRELRRRVEAPANAAALQRAGVKFAFQSGDTANPKDFIRNVGKAVEAGLDKEAALRALTINAAEIFGVADRLGSIEKNKTANLIVATGDLFDPSTKIKYAFVDGRKFEIAEPVEPAKGPEAKPVPGDRAPVAGSLSRPSDSSQGSIPLTISPRSSGSSVDAPPPQAADGAPIVIKDATILTVSHGNIAKGSILVRDGKIAEVGAAVAIPPGATVIEAAGQYVMPGIIDPHSHVAQNGGINEGTVAVSSMTSVAETIDPEDIDIYRELAGGVTTTATLHGSANPIGGQGAVIKLRWGKDAKGLLFAGAKPGLKFALGENPKRGGRATERYPGTRMGVEDVIRQAFLEARDYTAKWQDYRKRSEAGDRTAVPPRKDLRLEPIAEVLRGERLAFVHAYRTDEMLMMMRVADEFGFKVNSFEHGLEAYKIAEEIAAHGSVVSTFSDWWAYKVEAYDAIPYNAALLTRKGVMVSINSDSNEEARHLNQEAAKCMKYGGLTEQEALRLVTLNPATQLKIANRVGSIDPGKDADLVIYNHHPLSVYAVVQKVLIDGQVYFDIGKDHEMRKSLEQRRRALEEMDKPPSESERPGPRRKPAAGDDPKPDLPPRIQ